ncbi:MFS transporter [Parabacteroides sp. PF5-9]|uniref:MFS transporter n=1 Tax=Parabacteroides sp. PF5-9 TaxID=1742404 RepID=UPI0024752408|nr:MFS transporter [Parabacteroides sp. PF5-9]MDH6358834.1 MFS family permease [Parabacteroides sp. PF5-9]
MTTEQIQKNLSDSPVMRWTALILIASVMFFAYMFVDVLSPLQTMLEKPPLNWSAETYGTFAGSEYFLNVFAFFLIFAGIILDKMGVRFTAILSGVVMVVGASIKLYAISSLFVEGNALYDVLNSFWTSFPASAKLASVGFMIFGCGVEMAGVTVSKAIVKWFTGKELALAMGLEMAIARLGVFAVFRMSPWLAESGAITKPVAICCLLLCIGLLNFIVYFFLDRKLDRQLGEMNEEAEEQFKISDIAKLFTSKTFLIVAFLCVLYYSAIFPFQKFATNMLENRLAISSADAASLFSWFPIGAMVLTPLLGSFLDHKGKGASMLMLGAILMTVCHLIFALYPLNSDSKVVAYIAIIVLGVSFSLVPAALWPSVPKLVENRFLGSAYSVIFWIQNIGLMLFPVIIGKALAFANPGVADAIQAGESASYDYTLPMLIFASLGILAFILGLWLKVEDRKKGYGLELPNIQK